MSEWPTCKAKCVFAGEIDLACVLPDGHLRDGEQMHRDAKGNCWVFTLSHEDGREERV